MTGSPNPDNQPQPHSNRRFWFLVLSRTGLVLGVILLLGIGGGALWAWIFINERLAPLVQTNLQQLLGRPVQIGEVQSFSWNSLRFGSSSVPATSTDPDNFKAEAIQVQFDLWELIRNRNLKLNVTLVKPDIYIAQDQQGRWVTAEIKASPEEQAGLIQTELESIQVENGNVVLQPTSQVNKPKAVVGLNQVNGSARFLERNQLITFNINTKPANEGDLQIVGNTRPSTGQTNLKVRATDLLVSNLSRLITSPVDIQGGRVDGDLTIQLQQKQPDITLFGTVGLEQINAQVANNPSKITNTTGNLKFKGQQITLENINTRYGSIPVQAQGTVNTQTGYNVTAQVQPVNLKNILDSLNIKSPVGVAGNVQANFKLQGTLQKPIATGKISTVKTAQIDRLTFNKISTGLRLTPTELVLNDIQATPVIGGNITGSGRVALGTQNNIAFNLQGQNLPGDAIAKAYNTTPQIQIGNVSANTQISGVPNNLQTVVQLQAPNATYPASLEVAIANSGVIRLQDAVAKVAGGIITARGQLTQKRWQGVVNANGIQLSSFPQVPPQYQKGIVNGEFNLAGTTDSFQLADIQAAGRARVNVANQTLTLSNIRVNEGRWQAVADASQIQLNTFSEDLRGRLSGKVDLSGTVASFQPSDIQAAGQVRFSQGLAQLQQPLTAQFNWNGKQLQIVRATTPGLQAAGTVAILFADSTPQVQNFNLDVQAQNYNLRNLPFELPGNIAVAGRVDFNGKIVGTPTTPTASGNLQLENFVVNNLAFDPVLTGQVNYQPDQGTQLRLQGKQDQITFNLGPNNRPISFLIRRDGTLATGKSQGDNLLVDLRQFPLSIAQSLIPNANLGTVGGNLSGNFVVNLNKSTAEGNFAVTQPKIGRLSGDEFRGQIGFAGGIVNLTGGELRQGQGRYLLDGKFPTAGDQPLEFQLSFNQARVENILQGLNIFNLSDIATGLEPPDFAGAEVLNTVPVGQPNAPLAVQLKLFNQIAASVAKQQTQQQQAPIPTLAELSGPISGKVTVTGTLQAGLNTNFDLTGSNWVWGNYKINQVIANGSFADGVVRLLPLRVSLNGSLLAFSGQFSQEQLSGQARVEAFPVELIEPFLPNLPVEVTGKLNGLVTLAGSLNNPSAIGEIALIDGSINKQPIQSAQASLNYNNARLNFGSTISVTGTGTEPVEITGNIPLDLPFATVKPDSDQITVNAYVENEGLAILNVLTDQVSWVSGQGNVNIQVEGTLKQPSTSGLAIVRNATLKSENLSKPLTDVTGTIRFAGDRLIVQSLQGKYTQGKVNAVGILPIFSTQEALQQAATNPLTVVLDNLKVNLPQLYTGGASGNVIIKGTAQTPQLSGNVTLKEGEISLGQSPGATSATDTTPSDNLIINNHISLPTPAVTPATTNTASPPSTTPINLPIEFADFLIILDDDVRVTQSPLFSFVTQGDITLNGTLANPRPQGVISLKQGQVNLFVTRFTLARDYEQTATFTPRLGFDPILDVRLVTLVPQYNRTRLPNTPTSSEISDTSANTLGTFNTVRIQASVEGPASKLSDNLELTSEPRRAEAEIVALIGGSFLNVFGQPDATSIGIATLTNSAIFSEFQGNISQIAEAIGLRSFQIFPTIETSSRRNESSVLSLAAEAAISIFNNASFSVSRVFFANESFRYNLLYELNDKFVLRGSTNLTDESRAEIQFETRF